MAKILLIAPTCDGEDIGEAWVAFQWAKRLPERHDVTLLTYHKRGRTPASAQLPGSRVIEWTEPPLLGVNERLNSLLKPAYPWFYFRARKWIKRELRRGGNFDIVHQTTPVAMRYPSPGAGLGIPFIIGPVGGGMESPEGFAHDEGSSPWFVRLRSTDQWRFRHDPLLRRTYSDAMCVLGIAPYVRDQLHSIPLKRFQAMSETGLETVPERIDRATHSAPLRLLYVGRLVRTKGARDIIAAMGSLRDLHVVLDIIGDGPDRESCEQAISTLGLGEAVVMHGSLPRAEVDVFYRSADVFVFPSYREPGGNVVPEAMGFGLPLIVVDRGGPGAATDDECAIKLPVTTPDMLVRDLQVAIRQLAADTERRLRMGIASREKVVATGLWQSKMDQVDALYADLLDKYK